MLRVIILSAAIASCIGTAYGASHQCYPRMGVVSSQYEGKCPNSELKWVTFENDLGAFGRNCRDEQWTYSRLENIYYNHKNQTTLRMADCAVTR